MITLLASLVALYVIPALYKRLSVTDGSTPTMPKAFYLALLLFFILSFMGPLIGESDVAGRGTSTAVLFIALPLFYIFVAQKTLRHVIGSLSKLGYIGMFCAIFILLYPLDLSVGYDAGRDLGEHMLSILGFYIGLSLAITYLFRKYAYSARSSFVIGGLLGVLVEQNFLGPILLVTNPIGFLIFTPMIFLTYAMYLLTPCLLINAELGSMHRAPAGRSQEILLFVSVAVLPILVWLCFNTIFDVFGIQATVLQE